jgi:hypothetical protein
MSIGFLFSHFCAGIHSLFFLVFGPEDDIHEMSKPVAQIKFSSIGLQQTSAYSRFISLLMVQQAVWSP